MRDNRKNNGGARAGSGAPKLPDGEKKIAISVYVKEKHCDAAKKEIKAIAERYNAL